ncbi:MAG TPA: helix-turn-helix domain-containing protein [Nitrososphaera sp.]|nr:helix-turn-helix domain-containing protein [Nitrososphaera sp.]
MGTAGGTFVPFPMGARSGYSVKCGKCDGKGWLPDRADAMTSMELESQIVLEILKEHSAGLNIDDIARLSKLDIPSVYRVLQSLKDKGIVGVKGTSPIIYCAIESDS